MALVGRRGCTLRSTRGQDDRIDNLGRLRALVVHRWSPASRAGRRGSLGLLRQAVGVRSPLQWCAALSHTGPPESHRAAPPPADQITA